MNKTLKYFHILQFVDIESSKINVFMLTDTQTPRQTNRHTPTDEYQIVTVDKS